MRTVFSERFDGFRIGNFPFDPKHSAIGEYHYYPTEGDKGAWHDPVVWYGWLGPSWIITEEGGAHLMEQTRPQKAITAHWPTLAAGEARWRDTLSRLRLRPLSSEGFAGLAVRYLHARAYYCAGFEDGQLRLYRRDQDAFELLAACDFELDCDRFHLLEVACEGEALRVSVDGLALLEAHDGAWQAGKIALLATMPTQFAGVDVVMSDAALAAWQADEAAEAALLASRQAEYPQPALWRKIDLQDFGTGRQIRFGHLLGGDATHIVLAQHQKRGYKDAYAHISCLTAIDLEGRVLWQLGEASRNPDHAIVSCDLPFQVYDIDGDGADEVIVARDFKLMILDGATGAVRKSIPTPFSDAPDKSLHSLPHGKYAFDRVNVDAIRICNFRGRERAGDILIKDRYSRLWAFDDQLQPLWHFHEGITGHFPLTLDINGDGREEMFVGYHLVDADGKLTWTLPVPTDHTDEILIGRWNPKAAAPEIALASGDEGFIVADLQGRILQKHMIGHAQRISVGNYRPDLPGLEISVTTFWGYQGIVYLFDCEGRLLDAFEPEANGNLITPVNWRGDHEDLRLLSANVKHGGLVDGHGRRVVRFPDDGHPELCAEAIDLTGDGRDDIVVWDTTSLWIYTQDHPAAGPVIPRIKTPHHNASNYRGEHNYPEHNAA